MERAADQGAPDAAGHRGRQLDASRDAALRDAALELLAEIGYDRLSIEAVAARARASKMTIYRRWSGKAELVADAISSLRKPGDVPDTGSLRGDLEAMASTSDSPDFRFDAQLVLGLVTALARDPELRQVAREQFLGRGGIRLRQVFERAVARGEIPAGRNLDLLVSVFPALALHHLLLFGELPDASFAAQVMNEVILPLAAAPL
ncbi:MAG TPA: TetR/AcrR family transcriptional regulator [Trebonia sp.]|jgi:AcrR family transcriptional regulator|nr:TetR/AcrR family transcriptional regulator [Trebonia sp.]